MPDLHIVANNEAEHKGGDFVLIAPPPLGFKMASGREQPWSGLLTTSDEWKFLATLSHDLRLKRIDYAVFFSLFEMHGYKPFRISIDDLYTIAEQAEFGPANKVALSIKRLARCGYLSVCPPEIFAFGLDRKAAPPKLRAIVLERDGYRCKHCGSTSRLEADHIVARSKGGETILENLQTLCAPCNVKKGAS